MHNERFNLRGTYEKEEREQEIGIGGKLSASVTRLFSSIRDRQR